MRQRAFVFASLALTLLFAGPARAEVVARDVPTDGEDLWIHVRVLETGEGGAKIDVNLPFSLLDVALDLAPDDVIVNGKFKLDSSDVTVAELRRTWNQLRAAGEAEFVTIEEEDETVRIARVGDRILVHVTDGAEGGEKTRIEVPISIVDALLAGEGDALDVRGALKQLKTRRGEILSVDDGETQVRIWIDERSK